ncbi:MAG TPA: DMT family transporter [Streptosporangiaceae bacterium]
MGCAGVLCFSGTAPATRVAVPVFGALTLTAARIVIAAVLGTITLALTGQRSWPGRSQIAGILVMGAGLAVGYPGFLALAVGQVPAYHAAVVIGLVPAANAVVSVIRTGERPRNWFWLGCLAGLGAVVAFAAIQDGGALHPADAWLGAAVLSCAIGYVEGGRVSRQIGATRALCWAMIFLAPLAALALAVSAITRSYPALTLPAWAGLWYAGTASMFAGAIAWYRGLAAGGIARIGQLNLAQPFLAITWSGLLLGEHIPGTALIAPPS